MANDLEQAFKALTNKKVIYDKLFAYYDGNQPLTYTAKRLEPIFKELNAYFAENWCSVVIDSCRDRVNLRKLQVRNRGQQKELDRWWERLELSLESDEVHEAAMVASEAFVIAWDGDDDEPEAYFNDPRMCHIFYEAENPRKKRMGAKWWTDEDGYLRMTLYYSDRLEYYRSTKPADKVTSTRGLEPMDPPNASNPYGEVPVFHFRMGRRAQKSDLESVIPVQNGINKLLTDMMVAAEYGAFKQRYIISNADTNGQLKNAPNEIWNIPGGDGIGQQTQVGQFEHTPLDNYLRAIDNLATAISSITRTPKHYFFSVGSNLSGEALIAMEAPLNKKAQDRIDRFTPVWKQVAAFLFKITGQEVSTEEIEAIFDTPETVQPWTQAQTREMLRRAEVPWNVILRDEGRSEAYIAQFMAEQKKEKEASQASLGQALLNAQRQFSQPDEIASNPAGSRNDVDQEEQSS